MQASIFLIKHTKDARKSTPESHLIHKHLLLIMGQTRELISRVINRFHSAFKRDNYHPRNSKDFAYRDTRFKALSINDNRFKRSLLLL